MDFSSLTREILLKELEEWEEYKSTLESIVGSRPSREELEFIFAMPTDRVLRFDFKIMTQVSPMDRIKIAEDNIKYILEQISSLDECPGRMGAGRASSI